jgi:hypothetical protein
MLEKKIKILMNYFIKNPVRNIIIFGILLRLFLFVVFYHSVSIFPDTEGYTELSELISSFNLNGYGGLRSPGYPLIISLLFQNLYAVIFFQFGLGIMASIFWYKSLLNFHFSSRSSCIITVFIAGFLNIFFFETCILVETTVLFLISYIILLLSKNTFDNLKVSNLLFLSFIFGYLVLLKPFYAFLPFLFIAFIVLKKFSFKRLISSSVLIIVPLFIYFGWCYINERNTGYFAPTTYYGLISAQNCVYFAEKAPKEYEWIAKPYVKYREKSIRENREVAMSIWYAYEDGAYNKYNLTFQQLSTELGKFAKVTIKNNPQEYLKQIVFRSWFDFWKPTIYWNYDKFNFKYANKMAIGVWYIQYVILLFFRLFFITLMPYYFVKFLKNRQVTVTFMLTSIVFSNSILQAIVTYGTNDRFSFPFEFIMIIVVMIFFRDKKWFPTRLMRVVNPV